MKTRKKFRNTRNNKQLKPLLGALSALVLVELTAVLVVAYFLIPMKSVFWLVTAFVILAELVVVPLNFGSLLLSAHKVKGDSLYILLGRRFRGQVSIDNIDHIMPYHGESPRGDFLGLTDKRRDNTLFCLGGGSRYLLDLKEPQLVKAKALDSPGKNGYVDKICLDVDAPQDFEDEFISLLKNPKTLETMISAPESQKITLDSAKAPASSLTRGAALEFRNLTYSYGDHRVVKGLNLTVEKGKIFAFLGHNGAGKSTKLKMLTGLLKPQEGNIYVNGEDIWSKSGAESRRCIGFVPDNPILYKGLTPREHLDYTGNLWGIAKEERESRSRHWLKVLDLEKWEDQVIETYSQGMQRKVSFALAMITNPELLVIDELTNAYDAVTLATIKETIYEMRAAGKTVFFSGHVMAVAQELADEIAILQAGACTVQGSMSQLQALYGEDKTLEEVFLGLAQQ